jgi:hypothetical protein
MLGRTRGVTATYGVLAPRRIDTEPLWNYAQPNG